MTNCIICDLDGTLSLFDENKNPYDRDFENDKCSQPVRLLLESYQEKNPEALIYFFSGRSNKFRNQTVEFLTKSFVRGFDYELIMRKNKDFRKDTIVKEEMYNTFIKDNCKVDFVIDDRLQVCRLWYSLGLFVFNVNQGLIEF